MTATLKDLMASMPALKEAQGKLDAKRDELHKVFEEAGPELDMSKVTALEGDSKAKVEAIQARNAEINDLKAEVDRLIALGGIALDSRRHAEAIETGAEQDDDQPKVNGRAKSLGRMFVESQAFKGYAPGSGTGPTAHLDIDIRNTLFQTSAGWDPEETRTGRVELIATRPAPHVIEAIPQTRTNQSAVVYMEETTFTNNAAEAAEGGAYGEAALVLTEKTSTVRKIAVWLPVTDEQFEDEQRAEDYVNNRLVFMLRQRLDSQVLVGDGIAPNLLGTENVSGIQTQALDADPIFDAFYKLFRKIRDNGFAEPSAFFITPANWEDARLARTTDGIYVLGNPGDTSPVRLWGVPGIETTAAPATKALAGDYRNFSELAVKRGVDVQVTNSHSTDFINGKLAIRADLRVALVHYRPKAFGEVTGL